MSKQFKISIPSPCHENWDTMTPAEKGRFCGSCQKVVHDFTMSSDREVASILTNEKDACGRFLSTQLDRELIIPIEKRATWMAASVAAVTFLTIGTGHATAQVPVSTEQSPVDNESEILGKMALPASSVVTGVVLDEERFPIPGTSVYIEGIEIAQTDFDGKYSIQAQKGQILTFSFVGFRTEERTIDTLLIPPIILTFEVKTQKFIVMGYRTTSPRYSTGNPTMISIDAIEKPRLKRTFFGRIFQSVGNLFRKDE